MQPTAVEREVEQRLCAAMLRSRYWKWQLTYLAARRDALIARSCSTATEAAMTQGALQEIARLMNGPAVVAKHLAAIETDIPEPTPEEPEFVRAGGDLIDDA